MDVDGFFYKKKHFSNRIQFKCSNIIVVIAH